MGNKMYAWTISITGIQEHLGSVNIANQLFLWSIPISKELALEKSIMQFREKYPDHRLVQKTGIPLAAASKSVIGQPREEPTFTIGMDP